VTGHWSNLSCSDDAHNANNVHQDEDGNDPLAVVDKSKSAFTRQMAGHDKTFRIPWEPLDGPDQRTNQNTHHCQMCRADVECGYHVVFELSGSAAFTLLLVYVSTW
jgi:hypothetical protein